MSQVKIQGNASGTGTFTIAAPNSNTDRTLTLPDATGTVVLADATQTLTNKSIAASQLTGALPALDGSALTDVSSTTLLGTLTPTSGSTATLSGLVLTTYKMLIITLVNLSTTTANSTISINGYAIGRTGSIDQTGYANSGIHVDLASGWFWGADRDWRSSSVVGTVIANAGPSGLSQSSTSVSITTSSGTFDAGTIRIWGVR